MREQRKQSLVLIIASLTLLTALVGGSWTTVYGSSLLTTNALTIPTFTIVSVSADQSVTIQTANFPANDTFKVLMGQFGTRGVGGILVDTISSGSGGSFTKTFNVPAELKGQRLIAIRLESPTSGFFSYNWFFNNTSGTIPGTGGNPSGSPTATPQPFVIPTFTITGVTADQTVSIKTANFPANDTFNVLMGKFGTRGVGGITVTTVQSGTGGSFTATFNIPAELKGLNQIAIRLESPTSRYFSYNWFFNNTSGTVPGTGGNPGSVTPVPTLPAATIPTFTITGVVKDGTVSIKTANFPANDTFTVLMGKFGTRGVGGVEAGTFSSGTGGVQTATFNIPASLQGVNPIAIRLQSSKSGYFSYNWFFNVTTP